jgi:methionyl-tRNA formyltransferase
MKFVYFGSAKFSRIVLETLYSKGVIPSLIVSQPDKPKGRGLKVLPTEVSVFATQKKIPLIKPGSLKEQNIIETINSKNADFFVVADYGKILPLSVLSLPRNFSVGIHPSLLPYYRGAAPMNWALINGDKETGVTIFKMNEDMDGGQIILSKRYVIEEDDDIFSLTDKLAKLGALTLIEAIGEVEKGKCRFLEQELQLVSFAPKLRKEDGKINWENSALDLKNLVRAVLGWPCAYTYYKNKKVIILEAEAVDGDDDQEISTIIRIDKQGIYVSTGQGILKIRRLVPEGKKEMDAYSFVCGYHLKVGDEFTQGLELDI